MDGNATDLGVTRIRGYRGSRGLTASARASSCESNPPLIDSQLKYVLELLF